MKWFELPLNEYFTHVLSSRNNDSDCKEFADNADNLRMLLKNPNDTVEFLSQATVEETACAVEELEDLVTQLPKEQALKIFSIFKDKLNEFPNIQNYSLFNYEEELKRAESIINNK